MIQTFLFIGEMTQTNRIHSAEVLALTRDISISVVKMNPSNKTLQGTSTENLPALGRGDFLRQKTSFFAGMIEYPDLGRSESGQNPQGMQGFGREKLQ